MPITFVVRNRRERDWLGILRNLKAGAIGRHDHARWHGVQAGHHRHPGNGGGSGHPHDLPGYVRLCIVISSIVAPAVAPTSTTISSRQSYHHSHVSDLNIGLELRSISARSNHFQIAQRIDRANN